MDDPAIKRDESIILTGGIFVSNARVEIGGRTFDPSKITEAKAAIQRPHRSTAVIVAAFSMFFLLFGWGASSSGERIVGDAVFGVGMLTAFGAYRLWKSKHFVILIDGEPQAFVDMDGRYAAELANAINKAIAESNR